MEGPTELNGKFKCVNCKHLHRFIFKTGKNPQYRTRCEILKINIKDLYGESKETPSECPFLNWKIRDSKINELL